MSNHLGHSLPWNTLNSVFERNPHELRRYVLRFRSTNNDDGGVAFKQLQHFVQCLHKQLEEFRSTDKTSEEEKKHYSLDKWHDWRNQACLKGSESVLLAYVGLNLLLVDEKRWRPIPFSHAFSCCIGLTDMGHPEWLAKIAREIVFSSTKEHIKFLKDSITSDTPEYEKERIEAEIQSIRSLSSNDAYSRYPMVRPLNDRQQVERIDAYMKLLFRILYSSQAMTQEEILSTIRYGLGVHKIPDIHEP